MPTQPDVTLANPHLVTFGLFVVLSGLVLGTYGLMLANWHPVFLSVRQLTALPLLFLLCTSIIFCVASNSVAALGSGCGPSDGAGRYVVPLVDALPFLVGTLIIFPGLILQERQQRQAQQDTDAPLALRFTSPRKFFTSLVLIQVGLLVVLALYFGMQGIAYAQADPNYTFQATGCLSRNPTNVDPIVNTLEATIFIMCGPLAG